ncbi:MAG TPA: Ig-like domain-containing protein, partial [Nevskiaceae bacterium]|nr:Ig-like domain-containing protein [Nevskiaceae bacterium]
MVGLAGCSGDVQFGDGLPNPDNPGGTTAPPANINIVLSSATLLSSASDALGGVTITAIVTDAANNTIQGAPVAFAATSGALQVTQAVTDASGVATAILTTGGDPSIRQIIVGAASGSVSRTAAVQVVSSTASGPPVDSLALLPATGSLTPSGSLDLSAFVANSGSPNGLAGVPVTWATSAGLLTGLTLPDHTSVSDSTGNAHATLTTGGDPTLTSITVTATAGGHSQSRTYTVAGGGVGVSALNLVASGTQLAADADQVAEGITIRAIATDSHGNVVSGVPVSFAIPPPSSGALIVTQGTTDENGQAIAILTTGGNPAPRTINVTATVGTLTRTLSPAIQVVGSIGPVPAALNVFASAASLPSTASAPANGVTVSAVVTDANGVTVPGIPVTFSAPGGAISVTQAITDANGIATAVLTTGGNPSPRTINVTASTGSISRTIGIAVIGAGSGPTVNTISLTASSTTLPASATTSGSAGAITLTAFVRDSNNNAVPGAAIAFSSTAGQLSQVQTTSDANGQATAVLSTGGDNALPPTITVSATASGHTASLPITVVNGTSVNASSINVIAASPTLSSSANTPALGDPITATVLDSNLNPVPGVTVQFSTSAGALANISATTDANGQATAVLTTGGSNSLPPSITVTAKVGSITGSTNVSVVSPVGTLTLLASAPQLPSAASTVAQGVTLTALVTDSNGNLVSGVPVTFSAPGAGIQVTQGTTDASGTATAILTTGGNPTNRNLTVTASASGTSDSINVAVTGTTLQINGP